MIIKRNDKTHEVTIYTSGTSLKTELVRDICRRNRNYNDKSLFYFDNHTLEVIRKLTMEGFFVAYAELNHSTKKLFVKGLNLSDVPKSIALNDDYTIRYFR